LVSHGVHFARELGLKVHNLEVDDDVAVKPGVIKEQVEEEFLTVHFQADLISDKGEARAKFD
jgi:hypothetical protein